jgi:hypothetical protein
MVEQDMMTNPMSPTRAAILTVLAQAGRPMQPIEIAAATGKKYGTEAAVYAQRWPSRTRPLRGLAINGARRTSMETNGTAHGGLRRTCYIEGNARARTHAHRSPMENAP